MRGKSARAGFVYRTLSGTVWIGESVYVLLITPSLLIAYPLGAMAIGFLLPLPFVIWMCVRVRVVLFDDGSVAIRNVRSFRIPLVAFAVVMPTGSRGTDQVNFVDKSGVATAAHAMTLWRKRGRTRARSLQVLDEWVARCAANGVMVSLDDNERRRESWRADRVRRGLDLATPDPAEALRTVRRASVGDALISVRSAKGGFVVTVESVETPVAVTTEVYPTMDEAIARGIEEIGRLQEHPV